MLSSARTVAIEYDYGHPEQAVECCRVMLQVASMAYGVQANLCPLAWRKLFCDSPAWPLGPGWDFDEPSAWHRMRQRMAPDLAVQVPSHAM